MRDPHGGHCEGSGDCDPTFTIPVNLTWEKFAQKKLPKIKKKINYSANINTKRKIVNLFINIHSFQKWKTSK